MMIGDQFYWQRKPEYPEKPPTCSKSLTNFIAYCCIEYNSPEREACSKSLRGNQSHFLVVIGTDCIGSCNSNYHTSTTATAPERIVIWSTNLSNRILNSGRCLFLYSLFYTNSRQMVHILVR